MNLRDFIERFIEKNTLIRVHTPTSSGHKEVIPLTMEWELLKTNNHLLESTVIGVTDILHPQHPEAVNIVVTELTMNKIEEFITSVFMDRL